jgi:phosphatidylethanolamine-binding protein (PEBP) family uncharacterized protein
VAFAAAVGGCGSSNDGTAAQKSAQRTQTAENVPPRTQSSQKPDLATILLESELRQKNGVLNPKYTCKGKNVSPPVIWSDVPSGTQEDVVLVRSLTLGKLETNWVVAGISPRTYHLAEGTLPAGAIVGRNSAGETKYSLCPSRAKPALVVLAVLALPHKLGLKPGFDQSAVAPLVGAPGNAWGSLTMAAGRPSANAIP